MTNKNKLCALSLFIVVPLASIAVAADDQPGIPTNPHELIARLAKMPDDRLHTLVNVPTELILTALAIEVNEEFAGTQTSWRTHACIATMYGFHTAARDAAGAAAGATAWTAAEYAAGAAAATPVAAERRAYEALKKSPFCIFCERPDEFFEPLLTLSWARYLLKRPITPLKVRKTG